MKNKIHTQTFIRINKILIVIFVFLSLPLFARQNAAVVKSFTLDFSDEDILLPYCIIPHKRIKHTKLGIALSGGGLRGVAQIGVLKALEENNIHIDYISGTSIGSVVGGLYASGYTPDEIWKITKSFNWSEVMNDAPKRSTLLLGEKQKRSRAIIQFRLENFKPVLPEALTPGQNLGEFLTTTILNAPYHSADFTRLKVPLRIVATDIISGNKIIIEKGDLAEMIRASISIPLLFTPVEKDSMMLIDGGVLDNIPVQEVRNFGADYVIAVNTTSPLRRKEELESPWEIADQVTTIMQKEKNKEQLENADIIISIAELEGTSTNQKMVDSLYNEGYMRTLAQIDQIKALLAINTDSTENEQFFINKISLSDSSLPEITTSVNTSGNRTISALEINRTLTDLYKTGNFKNLSADIIQVDDNLELVYQFDYYPVLDEVLFIGQSLFPDSVLQACIHPLLDKPINCYSSQAAIEKILKLYRDNGYSLAEIEKITYSNFLNRAIFYMSEGKISKISFTGHHKTRNYILFNEFPLQVHKIFRNDLAQTGVANIFGTGLFNSVSLNVDKVNGDYNLNIHLQEKPSSVVRYGIRYDDERSGRSFIELGEENFLGFANDITFHAQYGARDRILYAEHRADRLFNTFMTGTVNFHKEQSDYYAWEDYKQIGEYQRNISGAVFSIGQHIERFGAISAFMRIEEINLQKISGDGYSMGSLSINTIGFRSIVDTRDQIPFPTNGKYHHFQYKVSSGNFLGADISFFQVSNQLSTFVTYGKRHTFCPRLIWGTSDLSTPYSEQFRMGGEDSFYGLRDSELQGRHMALTSLEYRYKFKRFWLFDTYASFRYDIGAVWKNELEIHSKDFINGKGLALSINTPFGPLSMAYGKASSRSERLYISLGYNF